MGAYVKVIHDHTQSDPGSSLRGCARRYKEIAMVCVVTIKFKVTT